MEGGKQNRLGKDTTVGASDTIMIKFLRDGKISSTTCAHVLHVNFVLRKLARRPKHELAFYTEVVGVYSVLL
jgi:hypothetical protein